MVLRFGEFVFDPAVRRLQRGDEEIHLSPRTFRLLEILIEERPRAVPKRELMNRIWPDAVVEESNLKTTVSELRTALDDNVKDPRLIRTVHRFGYGFSGEVISDQPLSGTYRLHGEGIRVALSRPEAIIGRHPGCDVCIDSLDISRQHARISVRPDGIVIEDLGSRNGTWVGSERIQGPKMLVDGDRIRVGDVTVIFRASSGDESTRTATDR